MDSTVFCYWLQGLFEIDSEYGTSKGLTAAQVAIIKDHLKLVFQKVTPGFSQTTITGAVLGTNPKPTFPDPSTLGQLQTCC